VVGSRSELNFNLPLSAGNCKLFYREVPEDIEENSAKFKLQNAKSQLKIQNDQPLNPDFGVSSVKGKTCKEITFIIE